jgi:hypothetical protein
MAEAKKRELQATRRSGETEGHESASESGGAGEKAAPGHQVSSASEVASGTLGGRSFLLSTWRPAAMSRP